MSIIKSGELRAVPWAARDVLLGVALLAISTGGLIIIYAVLYFSTGTEPELGLGIAIFGGLVYGMMLLTSWVVGPVKYGAPLESLGLKPPASKGYFQILLPALVLIASLVFTAAYAVVVSFLGWGLPESLLEDIDLGGATLIGMFALVVLWAPLAEEVFFRGFIFPGLIGWLGPSRAAVVSSLAFAAAHVDPMVMVPIFSTGLLLAWLYHRTGSLWSSVAAHAMQNALAFSIAVGV